MNERNQPEEICYTECDDEIRREVILFKQQNLFNQKVKELTTDSKNGFSFKIKKD